jgi:hypothetical protein
MPLESGFMTATPPSQFIDLTEYKAAMEKIGFTPGAGCEYGPGGCSVTSTFSDAKNCKMVIRDEFTGRSFTPADVKARTLEIYDEGKKMLSIRYEKSPADGKFHYVSMTFPAAVVTKEEVVVQAGVAGEKGHDFGMLQEGMRAMTGNLHYYSQLYLKQETYRQAALKTSAPGL